ncbi:DUF3291 domain-containing protein [Flagellimonas nanhaiensis]|uniref:DUF3291 domain-containing protein n=1 Tax=Flagellimonas nanhaiensis TaxID=2292706 RepID=A0A371JNB9_9FLAO|nr:DUF3291 domain-containing protein [Allomuricauda nanhaiensis]RDY58723.1 DUF3291 domain-containing protein [Allomuricauda nanhaiensis]
MVLAITSIELKSPLLFFRLSLVSLQVINQLKNSSCIDYRTTGFWKKHYTITLWRDKEEMQNFSRNGNHLYAMGKSRFIAKEIRVAILNMDEFPNWKEAKTLLAHSGKIHKYE